MNKIISLLLQNGLAYLIGVPQMSWDFIVEAHGIRVLENQG